MTVSNPPSGGHTWIDRTLKPPGPTLCFFCPTTALSTWLVFLFFFFSSRRRHTRLQGDWSSDVCSSDLLRMWNGRAVAHRAIAFSKNRQDPERPRMDRAWTTGNGSVSLRSHSCEKECVFTPLHAHPPSQRRAQADHQNRPLAPQRTSRRSG